MRFSVRPSHNLVPCPAERLPMNDSAGAGGCPLAQTMAEGGLKVLLLERGGERVESSKTLSGAVDALSDKCTETLRSTDGVTVGTGNCMGGTSAKSNYNAVWR
jgi:choline dehydrogenase-like flavoprotein